MKKIVLILALLLFSFNNFASTGIVYDKLIINEKARSEMLEKNNNHVKPFKYTYLTCCGVTAVSYSYEPVSMEDYLAWGEEMNQWHCFNHPCTQEQ